jgi:demethylmenaquinone methyltransferase/2-methoxy-6-polyprenyl-1,4-benzoquinol methylase
MTHFNHFDFLAPLYDRIIKPADPGKISRLIGLPIRGSLLDVGGGTGRTSYGLKDFVPNIVIADSSLGMLNQASEKRAFSTICSYSEQLPFKNQSFERVIMVDALHHVKDIQITIDEIWRVVVPGGRIVIEEPNIQKIPIKFIALMEKLVLMRSHFISPEKIKEIFCYPNASIRIESEGLTSWVIIEKQSR